MEPVQVIISTVDTFWVLLIFEQSLDLISAIAAHPCFLWPFRSLHPHPLVRIKDLSYEVSVIATESNQVITCLVWWVVWRRSTGIVRDILLSLNFVWDYLVLDFLLILLLKFTHLIIISLSCGGLLNLDWVNLHVVGLWSFGSLIGFIGEIHVSKVFVGVVEWVTHFS